MTWLELIRKAIREDREIIEHTWTTDTGAASGISIGPPKQPTELVKVQEDRFKVKLEGQGGSGCPPYGAKQTAAGGQTPDRLIKERDRT